MPKLIVAILYDSDFDIISQLAEKNNCFQETNHYKTTIYIEASEKQLTTLNILDMLIVFNGEYYITTEYLLFGRKSIEKDFEKIVDLLQSIGLIITYK